MTLQQLTYFEAIARTQNLSRAAEELFIAQLSLSISMRKLEEDPILLIVPAGTAAPASWEEVLQHPLIGYEEGSAMTEVLLSISREIGYPFTFDFLAPNEEAVASLVSHGMGYAIAPYNRTMRGHEIAVLPLPTGTYTRKNCLTVKRGSVPHGQAAGDFIGFLNDFAAQTALGG